MDVKNIQGPEFLKDLSISECKELSKDIRAFLVDSISKTGGHLASNLGVVELTIALHKVFDSPKDKIFFDVGHQSYVHKILTGRAKDFDKLRQYKGISGFEKRNESIHDVWEAGHSSTSLSGALGMAIARDLDNDDYCVVPVIGDGALSSGMALEALNQIGFEHKKVIIVFNDNNMSISKNVGALSHGFARLRSDSSYVTTKQNVKKVLNKNVVGRAVLNSLKTVKDSIKEQVVDFGIFGEFGFDYLGPINGHNISDLVKAFKAAKLHDGPIVVHVITKKGKGYEPCENDKTGSWHGVGPFNPKTGKELNEIPNGFMSWSEFFSDHVTALAQNNKSIVVITPAMISGSKLEKFFTKFPDRAFDCGIAEEHATTMAAGLAINGKHPYLSIYSSFLQRSYDQVNHDICRMNLPVVIGIDRAGLVGADGDTHHGLFDIGLLRNIPNMILAQPKDGHEAELLLNTAFNQLKPFAIRYPRGIVKCPVKNINDTIEIGTWTKSEVNDVKCVVLTYGEDVDKITNKVETNNLPVMVVNCRFFKPLDINMLKEIEQLNVPCITYETDMLSGGLSSAILEACADYDINLNIKRIGIKDNFVSFGSVNMLKTEQKIDLNTLFDQINKLI